MTPYPLPLTPHAVNWNEIDDVLLDMDGTLLDRHFDNFFFEEELPRRYAALHNLTFEDSRDRLMAMYQSVEGELAWTDLHYWTKRVGIDVVALHSELDHMIGFLPGSRRFLALSSPAWEACDDCDERTRGGRVSENRQDRARSAGGSHCERV